MLWVVFLLVPISLAACDRDLSVDVVPQVATDGAVTLVLLPERPGSDVCCHVVTINSGDRSLRAVCHLVVFDSDGQLVYAGLVPAPQPGHRRSIGFLAPPGRRAHGVIDIPIDFSRDRYRATCHEAMWHGAPPI
jgi:hypothetical protein